MWGGQIGDIYKIKTQHTDYKLYIKKNNLLYFLYLEHLTSYYALIQLTNKPKLGMYSKGNSPI